MATFGLLPPVVELHRRVSLDNLAVPWLLAAFVRGGVHLPFATAEDAEDALESCGLRAIALDPRDFTAELDDLELAGAGRVRILEAIARLASAS